MVETEDFPYFLTSLSRQSQVSGQSLMLLVQRKIPQLAVSLTPSCDITLFYFKKHWTTVNDVLCHLAKKCFAITSLAGSALSVLIECSEEGWDRSNHFYTKRAVFFIYTLKRD